MRSDLSEFGGKEGISMPRLHNRFDFLERRQYLRKHSTTAELILWEQLRDRRFLSLWFRRQHSVGGYILDFFCKSKRLAIEVDGETHFEQSQKKYDVVRTEWLNSVFIQVIRFTNDEVIYDLDVVLEKLKHIVTTPNPSSIEEGWRRARGGDWRKRKFTATIVMRSDFFVS